MSRYVVKCDAELNTPDVIERNELRARISYMPVRAQEIDLLAVIAACQRLENRRENGKDLDLVDVDLVSPLCQ